MSDRSDAPPPDGPLSEGAEPEPREDDPPEGQPSEPAPAVEQPAGSQDADAAPVAESAQDPELRDQLGGEAARIAVLDTSYIGDIVFTSVLPHNIRRAWPEARVVLIARPGPARLAKGLGYSAAIAYDKNGAHQGLRGMDRVIEQLQAMQCRALLVPHRSVRSAMFAWRSKALMRVGFGGDRLGVPLSGALARFAFTHTVPHSAEPDTYTGRLLRLLEPLGIPVVRPQTRYRPRVDAKTFVTDLLADSGLGRSEMVALLPGSEWATKRWPPEHYARLADRLFERGMVPAVLGSEDERPLFAEIRDHMVQGEMLIDGMGTSLDPAAELMRRATLVVGGDTGLLHLGLAVGSRAVALFGPTDPAQHAFGDLAEVLTVDLPCRPCSAHGQESCPEKHHRCLGELSPDAVLRALLRLRQAGSLSR